MISRSYVLATSGAFLLLSAPLLAQNWTLVETRRAVKADTSHPPAEWRVGDHATAALKQWVDADRRRMTISATCSWQGIPGGMAPGTDFPVSVKIEQLQNSQTGYDTWVKLYPGEEGGNEGDGPSANASWREGAVSRSERGTFRAPRGSKQRYYIRAQCKVAGDYHETWYYYRFDQGLAAPATGQPSSPSPAPAAVALPSWTGVWTSNFGAMRLSQQAGRVTGSYDYKGGRIDGELSGNTLRGRWMQDNASGHFVFHLSADGSRFDGSWGRGAADSDGGPWRGTR